jgi:hypothetical protein
MQCRFLRACNGGGFLSQRRFAFAVPVSLYNDATRLSVRICPCEKGFCRSGNATRLAKFGSRLTPSQMT